ncbi:MAG: Lytic transglycosylase, catalytic, partial [Devosia sp.]|uniref:hypothetical protein n=1 Tax=Devosia sp. TaxID=1871048 RepID=UPI00260C2858
PTFEGSKTGGLIQGVRDTQNGAAQWLYNMLPKGVRDAGDSVDHFLYDKTGGAIGTKPGLDFNSAVADQNTGYEASRAANGRTNAPTLSQLVTGEKPSPGVDWMRAGGQAMSQIPMLAASPQGTAMAAGALGGALSPVTNMTAGSDTSFGAEKAQQIATGAVAGKVLGVAGGALSGLISPKIGAQARALMDEGMQLTPGQMFGGFPKSVEDKLTSVPVIGDVIKSAQGRAVDGLNTAAYGRVITPLKKAGFDAQVPTAPGRDAIDSISTQVSDAYNSLVPKLTLKKDAQLSTELESLTGMAQKGLAPTQAATFQRLMATVDHNFTEQGISSGKTLQGTLSDLKTAAQGYASDPSFENQQLGAALKTAQQSLEDGLKRSNPLYAKKLDGINEAFANLARIQSAGAMQGAANGVFSGAQLSAAVKASDKSVRDNAFARGNAFMQDLSDPAKNILGASVPNSGTTDRALAAGGIGALAAKPQILLNPFVYAGAAPALAYTKPGIAALNFAASRRPASLDTLGGLLRSATPAATLPLSDAATPGLLGR